MFVSELVLLERVALQYLYIFCSVMELFLMLIFVNCIICYDISVP